MTNRLQQKKSLRVPKVRRPYRDAVRKSVVALEGPIPDFELTWPSGIGVEVGTVSATTRELWQVVNSNAARASNSFDMHLVDDDGLECFVILKLLPSPISFVPDETLRSELMSIVADSKIAPKRVFEELSRLLPRSFRLKEN